MVGINAKILPAGPNMAEVTLIGGSSGYGESIVLRYGSEDWAIIDSCIDAISRNCLPLDYLREIGVDVERQVKYVFCTHWHDDHIKGLHTILDACSSDVIFCVSIASDKLKFLYEIERSNLYNPDKGVRKELILAMETVKKKGISVKRLIQDLPVFIEEGYKCFALSPSQKELESFYVELAHATDEHSRVLEQKEKLADLSTESIELADDLSDEVFANLEKEHGIEAGEFEVVTKKKKFKGTSKANNPNINDRSTALLFTIGRHHILLGTDLEVTTDSESGWQSVNDCICMKGVAAGLIKIPHHGSETGYHELFLHNHIKSSATGKLTTWIKGKKILPEKETLGKYKQHLNAMYITADPTYLTGKFKSPEYKTYMEETTESIVDIKNQFGIVQSRLDLTNEADEWTTKIYGSAKLVTDEFISKMA